MQIILETLLFENGREDEKASAGGAQVFLEIYAPTFNSTTFHKVVPAQNKYINMKDNVFSFYETHVLCQSGDEEAPPTLALHSHSLSRTSFVKCREMQLISKIDLGQSEILTESLILAQDERWRRA